MQKFESQWIVGIDEAGRGPLAGPVAVGAVVVRCDFDWDLLPGVGDSKKLSPEKREALFRLTSDLRKEGVCDFRVAMVHAWTIDRIGISNAVRLATARALHAVVFEESLTSLKKNNRGRTPVFKKIEISQTYVKLDGLLKAPEEFVYQKTIIRGDVTEKEIGLASILAKVTRDRYMMRIAAKPRFASYGFEQHKGYGTRAHRAIVRKIGLCDMHRRSYCKGLPA